MAALALQAFATGLVPLVLVKVVAPAYFAQQDTATPFRYGVVAVVTNVGLNLALFSWFGHVGLAFATSVSAWVNAGLLVRGITGDGAPAERRFFPGPGLRPALQRAFLASAVMGGVLWWLVPAQELWLEATIWTRAGWLGAAVGGGALLYGGLLLLTGERPRHLRHRV
jgi:putative peptidoglycan lipid II flippase